MCLLWVFFVGSVGGQTMACMEGPAERLVSVMYASFFFFLLPPPPLSLSLPCNFLIITVHACCDVVLCFLTRQMCHLKVMRFACAQVTSYGSRHELIHEG